MKEVFIAFLDFLKIPVGIIIPFLLLKGRLKAFMLRDLISRKVTEIDTIKNKVRRKVEGASVDFNSFDPYDKLTKNDTEFARDFFLEVYEAAFHAERNLATVAMISYRAFERFHLEMDSYCKKNGFVPSGVNKGSFYQFFNRSVEYIESCAVRSVEFPTKFSVKKNSSYGGKGRSLLSSDSVNAVDGFEQGPLFRPNRLDAAGYFLEVVGFNINDENYLLNKTYFSAVNGNSLSYFFFVDKKIAVPIELDVSTREISLFGEEILYFIGLQDRKKFNSIGEKDVFYVYYANISSFYKFVSIRSSESFFNCFFNIFGFEPQDVRVFEETQVIRFTILKEEAQEYFNKNALSISHKAYQKTGKKLWRFIFSSALSNPSLSYHVFVSVFYDNVSDFGAGCLDFFEKVVKYAYRLLKKVLIMFFSFFKIIVLMPILLLVKLF